LLLARDQFERREFTQFGLNPRPRIGDVGGTDPRRPEISARFDSDDFPTAI
jgi:hypothetical protein